MTLFQTFLNAFNFFMNPIFRNSIIKYQSLHTSKYSRCIPSTSFYFCCNVKHDNEWLTKIGLCLSRQKLLTFRTENNQNLFENMHGWIRVFSIYFQKKLSRSNANARDQLSGTESCANVSSNYR